MSSVQEALERRKKRNEAAVQKKSKVDTAVEAYKKRKQASSQSAVSDITNRINSEIEAIKSVSSPSWGSGTLSKTLESTRESRLNIEKLQREVESYKGYFDEETYNSLSSTVTGLKDSYNSFLTNAEVMDQFDSEDSYNKWYGEYSKRQEERKWVQSLDDFEANKGYVSTKKDDILSKMTAQYGLNYGDLTYEYINNQNNLRDEIKSKYRAYSSDNMFAEEESEYEQKGYDFLTDEEISIYNYYYNRHGKERAQKYIDSLEDELVQRKAGKEFKAIEGNTLAEIFYGAYAGSQQFRQGLENVGSMITGDKGFTPSSQYVSGMAREDLADNGFKILGSSVGQVAYDFLNTSANMLPSILVGAVTGGVGGAATLGASAMGNGYAEMRKLGYTENQARGYGLLVGASEAVLSYALGGISKLGGGGNGVFQTIASKIVPTLDNAIARVAIELGGNMLDEGLEEAIQEVLDPIFKMAATGEDFEGIDLENVLYSGLLGMLTAGVMEGAPTVANTVGSSINAKNIYGGNVGELVTESLEINPENAHAQRMQERLDNGKNVSGYQINRLVEANESAMVDNDIVSIENSAAQRLMELGETDNVNTVARAIAKQASGQTLKRSEQKLINESVYGERVANELNTKNIRSGEYSSDWAQKIDTNRINVDEYSKLVEASQIAQNSENKAEVQTVTEAPKVAETKAVEASEDVAEEAQPASKIEADVTDNRSVKESPSVQETESEEASTVSLEDVSKKYGAQSGAMINTYIPGQDVSKYDAAYKIAYDMGMSGVSLDYVMSDESTEYLSESQRQLAYEAGQAASNAKASEQDTLNKNAANGKTGRKRGVVKGEGVTIADLKKTFNDSQGKAYKILSTIADVTGVDIVLYKSEPNEQGEFEGAQGKFKWGEDTIYIDINAGIKGVKNVDKLAKYSMLRTFSHEFTHFLEKWNPLVYNEFRKVVFDELRARGENVHDLIEMKQEDGMSYEKASREVVAEAMTDILPDSSFAQELAENHKNIFEKLLEKLKEFVSDLKAYFNSLAKNPSREANALKEQIGDTVRYAENIVKMFDEMAVQAVENYQATVATAAETTENVSNSGEIEINPEKIVSIQGINPENIDSTEEIDVEAKAKKAPATSAQTAQETPTEVVPESEPFTITENAQYNTLEVKFDEKPSEVVRDILKENKFRWNRTKGVWYGKADRGVLTEALNKAYGSVSEEENRTPEVTEVKAPEGVGEYADDYERLKNAISNVTRYEIGGFLFRIYKNGDTWQGHVDKVTQSEGGYPVSDARGIHYVSEIFNNRAEAVEDVIAVARNNKLLGEPAQQVTGKLPASEKESTEEVNVNGENADNEGKVQNVIPDRQGDTRVLDEVETGDVQGDVRGRDSVGSAAERGQQTVRDDLRSDAAGLSGGSSKGDSESGDLRRVDGLTSEEAAEKAEKLHEEVTEQIEQQSTEQPKGKNFVIGESLDLPNGEKARYKANVEAIRLVKQLETEGRYATEAEQAILSKYVGWGGLANAFDNRKSDWSKEYAELKKLLTDEEYKAARASTLNAHYTDISVIKAMYDGLKGLGFTGGRMLEPSSGTGNFVGAMPSDMSSKVASWTMVELDSITGLIAKYLYPNADVRIQGFETSNIPNNYMDVAISNVPFGNFAVTDKAYPKKVTSAIHNYFFAKSLDKVRPGGIVMFITSSYTMNSKDSTVRKYIMDRADLLGAIRLPDTAFKGNAGTEVVTDILILKKRAENTPYSGENFLEAPYQYIERYEGANINEYFSEHPEMVLGTATMSGGMYRGNSLTYKAFEDKGSLADQIREAFTHISGKMEYPAKPTRERTNFAVERANKKVKENGLVSKDGKIYKNENGNLVEQNVSKANAERITGLLEIRDAAKNLLTYQQQGLKESEIKSARTKLNKLYDFFVKKYGFINSQVNKNAIKDDPDSFSIYALENWDSETKKATKSDLFSKNTITPNRTITSAKDVSEGLIVSINQTGAVDVPLIARLTGETEDSVTRQLVDSRQAFKTRDGLEPAEAYLSGNVRAKLREAESLLPFDKDYANNIEALKLVMPEDVQYQDIFVNPGTPWIPSSVYSDFAAYMLGSRNTEWSQAIDVTRNPETGNFTVELKNYRLKTNSYNTQKWGTARRSFLDLFDAMLNSKSVVIKDKLDDGTSVINKDATAAANEKIENITKEFQEWLWKDEARRTELSTLYNETFNSIVTPKYNGDNLTVNGSNALKPLRPHQRNAVQRVISSGGNTLLAHKVGAGKTYEMAAAAMKLKELGLVKKPMFAVPKSLVAQWGNEFKDFFPTARLLVAEASDFTAENRKVFMNRIANGEYDAVIVSYEQFEKLPMSDSFTRELYQEQIDSVIAAIEEAKAEKGAKSLSIKDLEKKRKSLQTKIDKLTDKAKDEGNIDFEQLGVDSLFIDEAHNFKNLFYTTSMTNVAGLGNKDGSKRAFDLYTKVRYLQKLNGGKGIVFATATPVMNSMSEMYIMQKYLQPDLLEQLGLSTFDAWAKQFGEVVNGVEIKPSGQGYRVKQSFSRFKNMSELQLLFRNFADVLTDIPGLKIPKMKGGKVNVVVCEPGEFQQNYMKELEKRADNVKSVDPSVDNMLKITSDGRKISYTQRMIDPSLPYEEGCKIFRCADNVIKAYKESDGIKGTQLIFCDMATPKGKSKAAETEVEEVENDMESAKLYDDIKSRLVKNGIPAKEIAFIHEADTDQKKKKLFADVNEGKVRVLIGSTGKMGVGMNAQKRVVAIHHLDAPWRPGDVEQRNGRAYRQGNINDEVECFTYVTEGSFDARLWDILERKQNFINQIMNGENVGRETEDTGEVTLSAAEVKALASGSPLILEQVQLDTDIKKLESLERAHRSAVINAKNRFEHDKGKIATLERAIKAGNADIKQRVDTFSDEKFSITVGKKKYTDKKDAGVALMAEAIAKANEESFTTIGNFAGFELRVIKSAEGIKGMLSGNQGYSFNTYPDATTHMVNHLVATVKGIDERVAEWNNSLVETQRDIAEQEKLISEPFAKQAELEQKRVRYREVMDILNPKEEQALDNADEDTVQEQSRAYLSDDTVQYQERTNPLTNEEVLELAAGELYNKGNLSDAERDALSIFQERIGKLTELQSKRAEQGRIYKEQQFGEEVDREAATETLSRMRILDSQIKKASEEVLSVENKAIFKSVLQKARKIVEAKQWEHDQEVLRRWRDRRKNAEAIKKYRDRLRKDVDELTNWVTHPNNKDIVKHVPDALKNSVVPFLSSINFISKRSLDGGKPTAGDKEFMKRLEGLQAALKKNIDVNGMYSGYNDLPPDFMDNLDTFIKSVKALADNNNGEFIINKMTSGEIKELSKVVKTLKKYIMQMNRFHNNAMFQHVYEAGDDSIDFMEKLNPAENTGKISNFVLWQQMRPAFAFERFGKGGMAIYDGLRRGQAKLAFNTKEIEAFATKAYTEAEVKAWEDDIKSFRLGSDTIKVPVSYIMGLYELSKDPDALKHIDGEGIRIATYTRKGKKISDRGHILTRGELNQMIGTLTQRQKDVADSLQKYMAEQGGKWGNYVSVARFGEELFTNKNYYPINSDGRHLQSTADEHPSAASLYALLNMSFTKSRKEDAKNRIVVYSIFDVFANHMASMAQYNAFALPILDAVKWFNYQQVVVDEHGNKTVVDSVRERMARAFGVPEETRPGSGNKGYAENFVMNIIKAFNGTEAQGSPMDATGLKSLRRYNMAQIAYNFRVVVQQPLAITRAALLLDYGSIVKGMRLKPAAIKKNIEEMQKYSGIAAWKSLGFYDVNISRGVTDIIKHESKFGDKVRNIGMWGAEKADILTWAGMWSAAKEEVMLKQHLRPESDGFYEAVTKLFEDVIYKTQVVDSVLTKNEFMRDKGFFARAIGSFMSEPTTTASMLIDAYDKYQMDMQRGMSKQQAWNKNKEMIGRVALVYAVSQVMLAAVQSISDAFRDDDDYQEWYEKWLEAFSGNLIDEFNLFNKLPIISDVYEAVEAIASPYLKEWFGIDVYTNPPQTLYMQWQDSLVNGWEIIVDKIKGADTNYTWYAGIFKLFQAASGAVGLPMAAATREVITAWNNTIGAMAPSLKVKTYDPGEKSEIKYAYLDGYLTFEEAIEQLVSQEVVDTKDEAYWTVQGWGKESYSKYDNIYSVVRNDGNINSAMAELTSHGLTEKVVLSAVKSKIGTWYKDGEITKQQAINKLEKYLDMDSDEITALVNKWSSKVVTGIDYDDIKNEYLSGNISASRAIDMRVLYGGETREKATQTVNEWKAFKDTGVEYGEIKEAFMDGDISAAQAKKMYMEYGGKSAKEAAETVSVLEFVKEYPETEGISYAAVEDYTMYCEHLGVPATVFYDVWKYNNEISADVDASGKAISGSKKTKVLQYINSLRLTSAQKDSLYYAFGWAQSKINEAPWR